MKAEKLRRKKQKVMEKNHKASESDRKIVTLRPKHLSPQPPSSPVASKKMMLRTTLGKSSARSPARPARRMWREVPLGPKMMAKSFPHPRMTKTNASRFSGKRGLGTKDWR